MISLDSVSAIIWQFYLDGLHICILDEKKELKRKEDMGTPKAWRRFIIDLRESEEVWEECRQDLAGRLNLWVRRGEAAGGRGEWKGQEARRKNSNQEEGTKNAGHQESGRAKWWSYMRARGLGGGKPNAVPGLQSSG